VADAADKQLVTTRPLFRVDAARDRRLALHVDFDANMVVLQKETRNLQNLGFRIPFQVQLTANSVQGLYPYAVSLSDSLRTYSQTCAAVAASDSLRTLVAELHANAQRTIAEGATLRWESHRLDDYARRLARTTLHFQEKVAEAHEMVIRVDACLDELLACDPTPPVFEDVLARIQAVVDDLSLKAYSNIKYVSWRPGDHTQVTCVRAAC
jgi:dynein heavy chain 1